MRVLPNHLGLTMVPELMKEVVIGLFLHKLARPLADLDHSVIIACREQVLEQICDSVNRRAVLKCDPYRSDIAIDLDDVMLTNLCASNRSSMTVPRKLSMQLFNPHTCQRLLHGNSVRCFRSPPTHWMLPALPTAQILLPSC